MNIAIEKRADGDAVVYADGPPGWWRPASPDESTLWARIVELEGHNAEHQSLAGLQDIRIAKLEQQLAEAIAQRDATHDELVHLQNAVGLAPCL